MSSSRKESPSWRRRNKEASDKFRQCTELEPDNPEAFSFGPFAVLRWQAEKHSRCTRKVALAPRMRRR
jgi:hypothetical protein